MQNPNELFFSLIEQEIAHTSKNIHSGILSCAKEYSLTPGQRDELGALITSQMNMFVQGVLGTLTNVGGVLPDYSEGYNIVDTLTGKDISSDESDYSDMWLEYLLRKNGER